LFPKGAIWFAIVMGNLSERMRMLRLERGSAPDNPNRQADLADRRPTAEDPAWATASLPAAAPQTRSTRDLLLLCVAIIVILVMNFFFWGTTSDFAAINPSTGRQIIEGEPWD